MKVYYVGVDCGGTSLRAAAAGPSGTVLGELVVATGHAQDRENGLGEAICAIVADLLADLVEEGDEIGGIGIGLPFVCWDGKAWLYRNVKALDPGRLAAELSLAWNCPVRLQNDVKCAALGEAWLGAARGEDSFVFVNVGTGLSSAIYAQGRVLQGAHGAAGEIAYWVAEAEDGVGFSEGLGPLEEIMSGVGLSGAYERLSPRREALTAEAIFLRAGAGDEPARKVIERGMTYLLPALANLATLLDPGLMVLGGGVSRGLGPFLPRMEAYLGRMTPFPPRLLFSGLGGRAGLIGAIKLAMG